MYKICIFQFGQRTGELQDDQMFHSISGENSSLFLQSGQNPRPFFHRIEYLPGMGLETDDNSLSLQIPGHSFQWLDHLHMPFMHSIETTDGYYRIDYL